MNINYELYRIFYTVANTGNITKAANELLISQPAISKSIKNLEEQLGGELFVRTKKGVTLTVEGREFFEYIEKAMKYIGNAESKFTDLIRLETGSIRIGISSTLTKEFLIPYLKTFHKMYPKIEIQIDTNITRELVYRLRNGLLDILVTNIPITYKHDDLEIIECKKIQDCFVVNEEYKTLTEKTLSLKELNDYPLILQTKGASTRNFLDKFCSEQNIFLKAHMSLASYGLVTEFTKIGFGIGYLTENYIKEELINKELYKLNIKENIPPRTIGIVFSKNHVPSFSTKKLIEIIKK